MCKIHLGLRSAISHLKRVHFYNYLNNLCYANICLFVSGYPDNNGGSEVTELELAMRDCSTDSKELRTAYRGRETETTVTDLTPATTYKFILRAANKVGVSVPKSI